MPEAVSPETLAALARAALLEITRDDTIGELIDIVDGPEETQTVHFANTLPGYPGWIWTVSVATIEGEEPTVLETELIPGETALLAPDWVPWVERLAEYEASQEAAGEHAGDDDSDDDESDDDELDDDESDDDDDELDDESDDDDEDDFDDTDDLDDLGDDQFDGVDIEEAAEEAGLDESGDDDENDDSDRP